MVTAVVNWSRGRRQSDGHELERSQPDHDCAVFYRQLFEDLFERIAAECGHDRLCGLHPDRHVVTARLMEPENQVARRIVCAFHGAELHARMIDRHDGPPSAVQTCSVVEPADAGSNVPATWVVDGAAVVPAVVASELHPAPKHSTPVKASTAQRRARVEVLMSSPKFR